MFCHVFFCLENWCKKRKSIREVFAISRQTLKTKTKTLFHIIWTCFSLSCCLLNQWFSVCCCALHVFNVCFVQKGRRKLIVNCFNDEYDEVLELMTSYSAASAPNVDKKMCLSKNLKKSFFRNCGLSFLLWFLLGFLLKAPVKTRVFL